ncbi:BRCA2-interacting transcriptional repressor EMSY-like [Ptychodera flava]|uniref:BRCA2-interacting transcriptional repressor EMSY-like n=1 Tax=Ptychodera flava TaxID=63121 RepID=UPI003969C520
MWPKLLDMSRDECKRTLRRLELEAYASVVSAFRAQGDLSKEKKKLLNEISGTLSISTERHRAEVRRAVNDEKLTTIADHMAGPNNSSEWAIEGRRLVPLMPRLVPQTAFTATATSAANAAMLHNISLPIPSETGLKSIIPVSMTSSSPSSSSGGVVPSTSSITTSSSNNTKSPRPTSPPSNIVVLPSGLSIHVKSEPDSDEKSKKRKRSNSASSTTSNKEPVSSTASVTSPVIPTPKTTVLPITSPKITTYMTNTSGTGISPVKITFTKAATPGSTSITPSQKVIIVSSSSSFTPSILQRSQNVTVNRAITSTSSVTRSSIIFSTTTPTSSSSPSVVSVSPSSNTILSPVCVVGTATTAFLSNTISAAKPRPKTVNRVKTKVITTNASSMLATAASAITSGSSVTSSPITKIMTTGSSSIPSKPSIQIVQEHGVKIITQTVPGSKILPKPITIGSSTGTPVVMVTTTIPTTVVMTTKPVTCTAGSHSNQVVINPAGGTRIVTTPQVCSSRTSSTSSNIITVTPKTLQASAVKTAGSPAAVVMTKPYIAGTAPGGKSNVIIVQKAPTKTVAVTKTTPSASVQKPPQEISGNKTIIVTTSSGNQSRVVSTLPMSQTLQAALKPGGTGQSKTQQVVIRPKPTGMQAPISEQVERRSGSPILTELIQQSPELDVVMPSTSQSGTGHVSPCVADETSSVGSGQSETKVEIKHTGDILEAAVAAITNGNQWVEYDVPMPTVTQATPPLPSTYQEKSASSAIKALLEIRRDPSKVETTRHQTIDLSKMAVPLQMPKTESPTSSTSSTSSSSSTTSSGMGTSILPEFFAIDNTPKPPPPPSGELQGSAFLQTATMEVEKALQERNKALQQQGQIQDTDTFPDLTIHKARNPQKKSEILSIEEQGYQQNTPEGTSALTVPRESVSGQLDPRTGLFHVGESGTKKETNLSSLLAGEDEIAQDKPTSVLEKVKSDISEHSELLKHLTGSVPEQKEIDPYEFLNRDFMPSQAAAEKEPQMHTSSQISVLTSATGIDTGASKYSTSSSLSSTQNSQEVAEQAPSNLFSSFPSAAEKLSAMAATREERVRISGISIDTHRQSEGGGKLKAGLIPLQDIVSCKISSATVQPTNVENVEHISTSLMSTSSTLPSTTSVSAAATCVMVESTSLDTSHMNIEDFTSQRLLHEEDSALRHEENLSSWEDHGCLGTTGSSSGSGTESTCSTMDSFNASLRASKRKRKAPIPIDEAPIPSNLPSWVRAALNLLQRVSRYRGTNKSKGELNAASWFTRPVDPAEAPGYHKIIKQPMDFGTVKRKLETGMYRDFNDFNTDMLLVRTNCMKYNPPGHEARKDCDEVFQFYTMEYSKMIDKWQKIHCTPPKSPKRPRTDAVRSPPKS